MALTPLCALGSNYERINGGIHRRTASIIGAPSIVRHLGLWDVTPAADVVPDVVDPRAAAYCKYLEDLKAVVRAPDQAWIQFAEKDLPPPDPQVRSGTIRLIRFWWYGMRATVRVEFRTEYVMITSILDLSVIPKQDYKPPADPADPQWAADDKLRRLAELFDKDDATAGDERQREFPDIARFLQNDLWRQFETSILDTERAGGCILGSNLGQVFADFRGVITGSTADEVRVRGPDGKDGAAEIRQESRRHFSQPPQAERTRKLEHGSPPDGWARDTLRRLWPLIECEPYLHEYEFTVSGFLKGRALFVTALGPKRPDDGKSDWPWTPVCNFIHSFTDDEWQLGRLVDRIMNLGTLRLAATVEIEHLIDVGAKVDELTAAIRLADQIIQDEIEEKTTRRTRPDKPRGSESTREASEGDAERPKAPASKTSDQAMADVRTRFDNINTLVSNDVLYRLERAEYYIDQFTKGAGTLRVRRIEGFQKYDEMVARRMSGFFGYVQLLRTRMLDVDSRMSALSRAYASLKAVKTDTKIEKIQEFGETALVGVLIPYYLGAAVFYYAFHLQGPAAVLPWQLLITFFSALVIIPTTWRMMTGRRIRLRNFLTLGFFLVYLVVVWRVLPAYVHD